MTNKYVKGHISKPELEERILEVTMDMFHKQGIKQVRMDDIAKTLSTVFREFPVDRAIARWLYCKPWSLSISR